MIIHSMTATFGKLEHETLTLTPGLNIVTRENEWGKSTWCAFLVAMLYGVDTRAKSTRSNLADKERFAPWSGSPMSGRMELSWQGRDITIERKSAGRIPLGKFRAFETATGLPVPELTAENCGEKLLGVERSVFVRTGFIRFRDLGVTDDEALRRRLNNLVTTGDENSAADYLHKNLRELKNRIRYNRTGLLPQAEQELEQLEQQKAELLKLEQQCSEIQRRLDEIEDWRIALENHRAALDYVAAREDAREIARAEQVLEDARKRFETLSAKCRTMPQKETAKDKLTGLRQLEETLRGLEWKLRQAPQSGSPEELPPQFSGLTGPEAIARVEADALRYQNRKAGKAYLWICAVVMAAAGALVWKTYPIPAVVCWSLALMLLVWHLAGSVLRRRGLRKLEKHYGSGNTRHWMELAHRYVRGLEQRKNLEMNSAARQELEAQIQSLKETVQEYSRHQADWEGTLSAWRGLEEAGAECCRAQEHLDILRSMARTAPAPEFEDRLSHSEQETVILLRDCTRERVRLEKLLGQCQGKMDALGTVSEMTQKLEQVSERIRELEQKWQALTIAQDTLTEAQNRLQRQFAPRIVRRAEKLMGRMTGGRYRRLSLGEDFSIRAGAESEDTLQSILWRSDGTVDQLYLALRLAVSAELLPGAPMILDDALVRFDDKRLKAALDILKDEAAHRQVILFTCQSREENML